MLKSKPIMVRVVAVIGMALCGGAHAASVAHPGPGFDLPQEGTLACRAADSRHPPPDEVPVTMRIDYSKPRGWVKVTMGDSVFERTSIHDFSDGPKSWGGDIERYGWAVNVGTGEGLKGWSWFSLAADRIDWKGFCKLTDEADVIP